MREENKVAQGYKATDYPLRQTGVTFRTGAGWLQTLFDRCEAACKRNVAVYTDKRVLREGSDYDGVWLETQPMGGEMYAKRDLEAALNNQLIFMENQRRSGRFPGMIKCGEPFGLQVFYDWLQGFCFPLPALRLYYLIGRDNGYLRRLQTALRDFDAYLWTYRDSNRDGCLETWCTWDTGEDNSNRFLRYGVADGGFGGEDAPVDCGKLPFASMDVMSYSCQTREVLATIADLLGEADGDTWRQRAQAVRDTLRKMLWSAEKSACFDRDCDGNVMDALLHNNLRCMYYGSFSQSMADAFIREHLLNPDEFWTPVPLPSIAANDPCFQNVNFNNWGGQPQGLTYQRAIEALQRYGHHAEIRLLGDVWLRLLRDTGRLVQQYDPFTGAPCVTRAEGNAPAGDESERFQGVAMLDADSYGPTVLAALEYLSLMAGVNVACDQVRWSALPAFPDCEYTQRLGDAEYRLITANRRMTAYCNGRLLFTCTPGVEVLTDLAGTPLQIAGIDQNPAALVFTRDNQTLEATVSPNEIWTFTPGVLQKTGGAPFDYPYRKK